MSNKDLKNNIKIASGINATLSGVTPAKGNICDLQGCESATFAYLRGTVTDAGTASGFSIEIQECDSTADASFTAVADGDLIGTEAALQVTVDTSDGEPIGLIGYKGTKRYVRAVVTGTTGTDAAIYGVWIKGNLDFKAPASATSANIAAT